MNWQDACEVTRVRVLVLREIVAGGGDLAEWQLRRALNPILGDLLVLRSRRPGRPARCRDRLGRFVAAETATRPAPLMPSPSGRPARAGAVDNKTD